MIKSWEMHVFEYTDPETEIDASRYFTVESTDEVGDVIIPSGCEVVAIQWGQPEDDNDSAHLYVFIRKEDYAVTGMVRYPDNYPGVRY